MEKELNFDLKLPIAPPNSFEASLFSELQVIYNSIRLLADQVAGGNMLDWVDYSGMSVVKGWSSFITKEIQYRYLNLNTVLVNFTLIGTSNSIEAKFTLPSICLNNVTIPSGLSGDNGVLAISPGVIKCSPGVTEVLLSRDMAGTNWTASGIKSIAGQFIYRSN